MTAGSAAETEGGQEHIIIIVIIIIFKVHLLCYFKAYIMGLRYIKIYKNMSMMCFAQNTKHIMHFRHRSYPSIPALLEKRGLRILSFKKKKGGGANA